MGQRSARLRSTAFVAILLTFTAAAAGVAATTGWVRIHHEALRGGGKIVYVGDIIGPEQGRPWVAVGYVVDSDGTRTPTAWSSSDGARWLSTVMAPTGSSERRDGALLVARSQGVLVAVGDRFDGFVRSAVWLSEEGTTWTPLTTADDQLASYSGRIDALASTTDGFAAVGHIQSVTVSEIWLFRSADGRRWPDPVKFVTPGGERLYPAGVAGAGDTVVMVGHTPAANGADGRIWVVKQGQVTRVDPTTNALDGPGVQAVLGVAAIPGGFVAGGLTTRAGIEIPTLWTSTDGLSWNRLPEATLPSGSEGAEVHRIVPLAGGGLLASGLSRAGPRVWRSQNGLDWTKLPDLGVSFRNDVLVVSVASDGTRIVVSELADAGGSRMFGFDNSRWERADVGPAFPSRDAAAAQLVDVAATASKTVAIGSDARERPLVLVTSDRRRWKRVSFPDAAARLEALTTVGSEFTIAGWRKIGGRAHLSTWTSRDGTRWRRLGGTTAFPIGAFLDVARDRNRFVAVAIEPGQRGLETSVWTGENGFWTGSDVLGAGIASAVCVGASGVTAIATRGEGTNARILAWTRRTGRPWPTEPELVATGAEAAGCAYGTPGVVVVGIDHKKGAATTWTRRNPQRTWAAAVVASTAPRASLHDVVWDGSAFIASGTTGARGQSDLGLWKSRDGRAWDRIGGIDPVFVEPGFQLGLGLVKVGGQLVVVGRHGGGDAGLWVGTP